LIDSYPEHLLVLVVCSIKK